MKSVSVENVKAFFWAIGIDPRTVFKAELTPGTVSVTQFLYDEGGRPYLSDDGVTLAKETVEYPVV